MDKTFYKQLEELRQQGVLEIENLICTEGVESDHLSEKCLKIKKDDLMFKLDGSRYLTELAIVNGRLTLLDNGGYHYSTYVLEDEKLMQVFDHLIEEYSPDNEEDDLTNI